MSVCGLQVRSNYLDLFEQVLSTRQSRCPSLAVTGLGKIEKKYFKQIPIHLQRFVRDKELQRAASYHRHCDPGRYADVGDLCGGGASGVVQN